MGLDVCILCLANCKVKFKRDKRKIISKFNLVFKYLLGREKVKDSNLRELADELVFCEKCGDESEKLLELQLQLECIQMEMVRKLKLIRKKVKSSRCLDGMEDIMTPEEREVLERIKVLHKAVNDFEKLAIDVPFVLLERCGSIPDRSIIPGQNLVKVELEVFDEKIEDVTLGLPMPDGFLDEIEEDDLPISNSTDGDMEWSPDKKDDWQPKRNLKRKGQIIKKKISKPKKPKRTSNSGLKVKLAPAPAERQPRPIVEKMRKKLRLLYKCQICDISSIKPNKFENHLMEHESEEKLFDCDMCPLKFSNEQYRNFHIEFHNLLPCPDCLKQFNIYDLPKHIRKTHKADNFPCSKCSHQSLTLAAYVDHFKDHVENPEGFNCYLCTDKYLTKHELSEHLYAAHDKIQKLECDTDGCGRVFASLKALKCHKCSEHDAKKEFQCNVCRRQFSSAKNLNRHAVIHNEDKRFQCDKCSKTFHSRGIREMHMIVDHDYPKIKCDVCSQEFISRHSFQYHRMKEHSQFIKCPVCKMTFGKPSNLQRHMLTTHTEEKGFLCEDCGKSFPTKDHCRAHKRIHAEKKFNCSYCPKTFTIERYLVNHERIHTGEKPYVCEICGAAFAQSGYMGIHRRKCLQLQQSGLLRPIVKNSAKV